MYKPNAVFTWGGADGILKNGQEYLVDTVRKRPDGTQEFTLKKLNGHKIADLWWKPGAPFVRRRRTEA
jgi:hypothetical protein